MRRLLISISLLALAGLAGAPAAARVSAQVQVFRTTADVVPLFVTVADRSGRIVADLTRSDVQVFDNGKPQPLTVFENTPQPIRLIVLLDVSGSMAGNLPLVGMACSALIAQLAPGDLARVGIFGREIAISPTFTRDARALADWLPATLPADAPTPLWTAVNQAMDEFAPVRDEGRHVVLVLSDGKDTGPLKFGQRFLTPLDITERAGREDVMIYGVGVRSSVRPGGLGAGVDLNRLMASTLPDPGLSLAAIDTGGGYFELLPRDDLAATFARVADELHRQYLLGFAPPARDGKVHKIEVRVSRNGLKVRTRKTYRAPK
jgi:VWFA-related protein